MLKTPNSPKNMDRRVSICSSAHEAAFLAELSEKLKISQAMVNEYHSAFCLFDKDGDGCVTGDELQDVFLSIGHSLDKKELSDLIHQADADKNGTIEFEEFVTMIMKKSKNMNWSMALQDIFEVLDRDKDGNISASELKYILTNLGESLTDEEVTEMINEVDNDKDGLINFREFIKMMEY